MQYFGQKSELDDLWQESMQKFQWFQWHLSEITKCPGRGCSLPLQLRKKIEGFKYLSLILDPDPVFFISLWISHIWSSEGQFDNFCRNIFSGKNFCRSMPLVLAMYVKRSPSTYSGNQRWSCWIMDSADLKLKSLSVQQRLFGIIHFFLRASEGCYMLYFYQQFRSQLHSWEKGKDDWSFIWPIISGSKLIIHLFLLLSRIFQKFGRLQTGQPTKHNWSQ